MDGIASATGPSNFHNVFIDALAVEQSTGSAQVVNSDITFGANADIILHTWNSIPHDNCAFRFSPDLIDWSIDIDDQAPANESSNTTIFNFSATSLPAKGFFRIE